MAVIIFELHGELLRSLAAGLGMHFAGLGIAARVARRRRVIDDRLCKKLRRVEDAFNVLRHITEPSAAALVEDLSAQLLGRYEKNDGLNETVFTDADEDARFATGLNEKQVGLELGGAARSSPSGAGKNAHVHFKQSEGKGISGNRSDAKKRKIIPKFVWSEEEHFEDSGLLGKQFGSPMADMNGRFDESVALAENTIGKNMDECGGLHEEWGGAALTSPREGQNAHNVFKVPGAAAGKVCAWGWNWIGVEVPTPLGPCWSVFDDSDGLARFGWATLSRTTPRSDGFASSFLFELWARDQLPSP